MKKEQRQQQGARTGEGVDLASDFRALMMDAVSGALPIAGAIVSFRYQAWWLFLFSLACLAVALVLASHTARRRSWVIPEFKCWHFALLTSLIVRNTGPRSNRS